MANKRSLLQRPSNDSARPNIQFWNSWPSVYRNIFLGIILLSLAYMVWFAVAAIRTPAPTIQPVVLQQMEPVDIQVRKFQIGILPVTLNTESYLIFERTWGSALSPSSTQAYVFLAALLIGLTLIATVMTTLSRYWFFGTLGIFIVILASFKLDSFGLFGLNNNIPFGVVSAAYGIVGYLFIFYRPTTPFLTRLFCFLLITGSWVGGLFWYSKIAQPLYLLASHGVVAGIVITIIFTFMVAHEIIAAFVLGVTIGEKPTGSLRHFMLITAIYLINLGLLFADKKHFIHWNFFPGSLYLLIFISAILGYWGFRNREPLYESILKANPFGVYAYAALSLVAFATIGFFLVTANDPPAELIKDAILYSHLGYGVIFLTYIIANFFPMLGENLPVYKVLYKPTTMPYFTFRLAGLIATFAFFAYANWKVSVNQMYAGQYNAIGDMYLHQDSLTVAENYYRRSIYFATRNYHAHYAVAQILDQQGEGGRVKDEYSDLAFGRPLDLAYLNWSQLYENDNANDQSARVLKEGLKDFPNNGRLQDALSLVYARLNRPDTALLLSESARRSELANATAETNFAGLAAKFSTTLSADSLANKMNVDAPGVRNNLMALASIQGKDLSLPVESGPDTVLNVYRASLFNNYLVDQMESVDTAFISKITALARKPINIDFRDYLIPTAAMACYEQDLKLQAFKLMRGQAYQGKAAKDYGTLGIWGIEQGAPAYAVRFLEEAYNLNWENAKYYLAIALTEVGDLGNALTAWDALEHSASSGIRPLATRMKMLITKSVTEATGFTDEDKYGFSRIRFGAEDGAAWKNFVESTSSQDWKARAIIDRCKKLEEMDESAAALDAFAAVKTLKLTDKNIYNEIMRMDLMFLAHQKQWAALTAALAKPPDGLRPNERTYFEALLAEQEGRTEEAKSKFAYLTGADPFQEEVIIHAIRYLGGQGEEKLKTYSMLVYAMDTNPDSPKLLKEHIIQSWSLGFDDAVKNSADKLKVLIPTKSFEAFLQAHPEMFVVTAH